MVQLSRRVGVGATALLLVAAALAWPAVALANDAGETGFTNSYAGPAALLAAAAAALAAAFGALQGAFTPPTGHESPVGGFSATPAAAETHPPLPEPERRPAPPGPPNGSPDSQYDSEGFDKSLTPEERAEAKFYRGPQ